MKLKRLMDQKNSKFLSIRYTESLVTLGGLGLLFVGLDFLMSVIIMIFDDPLSVISLSPLFSIMVALLICFIVTGIIWVLGKILYLMSSHLEVCVGNMTYKFEYEGSWWIIAAIGCLLSGWLALGILVLSGRCGVSSVHHSLNPGPSVKKKSKSVG
jgi:hypothetical protein